MHECDAIEQGFPKVWSINKGKDLKMGTRISTYIAQSLGSSGLALASSKWAYKLRPDLWATGPECMMDFGRAYQKDDLAKLAFAAGAHRLSVTIVGSDQPVQVLARSLDNIQQRIEWLAGAKVDSVQIWQDASKPEQVVGSSGSAARDKEDRLKRLRAIAAENPPTHECHRRREILAARAELEA